MFLKFDGNSRKFCNWGGNYGVPKFNGLRLSYLFKNAFFDSRSSDPGTRVNREWVTSQLKKMKDMASSRDVTNPMVRKSSVDGAASDDLSVFVSFTLVLFYIFLFMLIIKVWSTKNGNFPVVLSLTKQNKKTLSQRKSSMSPEHDFLNCIWKMKWNCNSIGL